MTLDILLETLLVGLPGSRPGGLLLSVLAFFGAASIGMLLGTVYAVSCTLSRPVAFLLMPLSALFRGIPPILLVFAFAHALTFSLTFAAIAGLAAYSFSHSGEILRAYVVAYPRSQLEAGRVLGIHPLVDWLTLRLPWSLRKGLAPLATHWISLLKDTGALIVIGIGELTTVTKLLASSTANVATWMSVMLLAGLLYLLSTLALLAALKGVRRLIEFETEDSAPARARVERSGWGSLINPL